MPELRFRYIDTPIGQIHIAECGSGSPVLLLHQTPRSWTEYRHVLPLLGARFHAIAMDTVGFGSSVKPDEALSVELFANGVDQLTSALGLESYNLVGHHTGGVIGVEVAARNPTRLRRLVLSATAYADDARRAKMIAIGPIDQVEIRPDGRHLVELWNRRLQFYGPGHEYALNDFVVDGLRVFDRIEEGHRAVQNYSMEPRLAHIKSEVLLLCGQDDEYSMPDVSKLAEKLDARSVTFAGAGVPLPEQRPEEFSAAVQAFLEED